MGLHPPKSVPSKLISQDLHHAVCYAVYDLGTHYKEGKYAGDRHEIVVIFEVPGERIKIDDKDRPMAISKRYTFSMGQKSNLRKDLESWRGRPFTEDDLSEFDLIKMLGANAQIQVLHKKKDDGTVYANIQTITKIPKDAKKLKAENTLSSFSFEDKFHGLDINIPKWVLELIRESYEYKEITSGKPPEPEEPSLGDENVAPEVDDLPF